jgi:hypothetical protein
MNEYKLEHILTYTGTLADTPEVIGPTPEGIRVNFYSTGGEITGPKVRGKLRSVGGDWMTIRRDGVGMVDVRTTFETHDSALIHVIYGGVIDFGEDGYDRFLRSDLPPVLQIRTAPRFSTGHPDYLWLNRLQCIGIGEYKAADRAARYDIYALL